jgi:hypothetical protein
MRARRPSLCRDSATDYQAEIQYVSRDCFSLPGFNAGDNIDVVLSLAHHQAVRVLTAQVEHIDVDPDVRLSYSVSPAATNDGTEWRILPTVVVQEFSNEERCRAAKLTLEDSLKEAGTKLKSGLEDLRATRARCWFDVRYRG